MIEWLLDGMIKWYGEMDNYIQDDVKVKQCKTNLMILHAELN